MKVALVHDYLVNRGGAERVVLALRRGWPDAPIFTSVAHLDATFPEFADADIRTSWLQRLSGTPATFRRLLPLYPAAFRSLRLDGFDVVVSSSAGFAHHVRPRGARHIVYCHAPPRFLWDERYDHAAVAPDWARPLLPAALAALRRADRRASARADRYVANGERTRLAIARVYARDATVVHPPVAVDRFTIGSGPGEHHLLVGRLMPHRNHELAVRAFTQMQRRLIVVGDGPNAAALRALAGPTVEFRGAIDDDELRELYASARGLVVPGEEDFGIAPLEANASGRPVVALGIGGATETVIDGVTGVLFREETPEALAAAVERADDIGFEPARLRGHADRFDVSVFVAAMRKVVEGS